MVTSKTKAAQRGVEVEEGNREVDEVKHHEAVKGRWRVSGNI